MRSTSLRVLALGTVFLAASACLGPQEDPTSIKDLRVIGMAFEPAELQAPTCRLDATSTAFTFARPVTLRALIVDPGQSRTFDYELKACASTGDRKCENDNDYTVIKVGQTKAGEFVDTFQLGAQFLPDGTALLQETADQDRYQGLGGIRVPVVLHLKPTDGEELYAQKLMIYSCRLFPQMKSNVQPVLQGMTIDEAEWSDGAVPELSGKTEGFKLLPVDFTSLQEDYTVPSLSLMPIQLTESWKVSWYTSSGTFGSLDTGGTDFSGGSATHKNTWKPDTRVTERTLVDFWFVVRDGRGGSSWLHRQAYWSP